MLIIKYSTITEMYNLPHELTYICHLDFFKIFFQKNNLKLIIK